MLATLESAGFVSIHNRLVDGVAGDIDHVAVGPTGVFAIETKQTTFSVDVVGGRLFLGDRPRQDWLDQVSREAIGAQVALGDLLDPLHVTVAPVICVHGKGSGADARVRGVRIVGGRALARTLTQGPVVLAEEEILAVAEGCRRAAAAGLEIGSAVSERPPGATP